MLENTLSLVVATGLIGLAVSQLFVSGLASQRLLRNQRKMQLLQLARLRNATQLARLNSQLSQISSTAGQWRVMEVVRVVDESADCKSFYLADTSRQELPLFYPGQYLMVRPSLAGKYQATRCYSLSVAPNSRLWRITVKRQKMDPAWRRDRLTGGLSLWLHQNIAQGDCLLIGGPHGQFLLPPENSSPLVLLAAGVGITPMASMLQYATHFTPQRAVSLYFQAQDCQHWPLGAEVHAYCQNNVNCRVTTCLSRATGDQLHHLASQHAGRFLSGKFTASRVVQEVAASDAHYFMCGPEAWMTGIREQLAAQGIPAEQIHQESFGGATTLLKETAATQAAHAVRFARSGISTFHESAEQSLWELAQANDIPIPSGCLSGVCGSCRVKLLSGTVHYDRQVAASLSLGECLTCVAYPTSDVTLEV